MSHVPAGIVYKRVAGEEHRVGEHLHLAYKVELLYSGLILSGQALYHIAVSVPHGTAPVEKRDTVPCVVVQIIGPQNIAVTVHQLDKMSSESGRILGYHIPQAVPRQSSVLLLYPHVPYGIQIVPAHIPVGAVALQIGIVVKEYRIADHFTVLHSVHLNESGPVRRDETDETVPVLLSGRQHREQEQQSCQADQIPHFIQPSR